MDPFKNVASLAAARKALSLFEEFSEKPSSDEGILSATACRSGS